MTPQQRAEALRAVRPPAASAPPAVAPPGKGGKGGKGAGGWFRRGCHNCGHPGHYRQQCPQLKARRAGKGGAMRPRHPTRHHPYNHPPAYQAPLYPFPGVMVPNGMPLMPPMTLGWGQGVGVGGGGMESLLTQIVNMATTMVPTMGHRGRGPMGM